MGSRTGRGRVGSRFWFWLGFWFRILIRILILILIMVWLGGLLRGLLSYRLRRLHPAIELLPRQFDTVPRLGEVGVALGPTADALELVALVAVPDCWLLVIDCWLLVIDC